MEGWRKALPLCQLCFFWVVGWPGRVEWLEAVWSVSSPPPLLSLSPLSPLSISLSPISFLDNGGSLCVVLCVWLGNVVASLVVKEGGEGERKEEKKTSMCVCLCCGSGGGRVGWQALHLLPTYLPLPTFCLLSLHLALPTTSFATLSTLFCLCLHMPV